MAVPARRQEVGRGERVLPGVWRLRLPLPWGVVPHVNAWALAAGAGVVLVDCGIHGTGTIGHLERALKMVGLRLELVRLLVCTHAHADHYGQAAAIVERTGCALWMHPAHRHMTDAGSDPEGAMRRRLEQGRRAGVPEAVLEAWAAAQRSRPSGVAGVVLPDRPLLPGVELRSDLGAWLVIETPGHAPSHVCLFQPERRLLITGDHVLGRVGLYYEHGWSPDPVAEFLSSLDAVEAYGARLALPGHGRTFADVVGHIAATRAEVHARLDRAEAAVRAHGPATAFALLPRLYDEPVSAATGAWHLSETLCYLEHLRRAGRLRREPGSPETWAAA
jgi:glyoxylase-like metal-dependent hydrolase (beta-lactamase superfamily II)